jgi:hypothetical protein
LEKEKQFKNRLVKLDWADRGDKQEEEEGKERGKEGKREEKRERKRERERLLRRRTTMSEQRQQRGRE